MKVALAETGIISTLNPLLASANKSTSKLMDGATDILIIGAGNAGMPAAIQAADLGARVLLVDKNPFIGGMLNISGGHISGANSKLQIAKGIEDSPALHYRDAMRMGRYENNSELLKLAVEHAAAMIDWLAEIGVEFTPESPFFENDHEHYSAPRTYMGPEYARSLLHPLKAELQKRIDTGQIKLQLNTSITKLLKNHENRIIGVEVRSKSGKITELKANAVILATGGYGASDALKTKYNPKIAKSKVICLPHATGDGIVMAEQVGARLINMDKFISFPGAVEGASGRLQHAPDHLTDGIWVNKQGDRFVNEQTLNPDQRERAFLNQKDFGFYYIFDHQTRKTGPGIIGWDEKQIQDGISRGIVKQANTVNVLARKINVDATRLTATIARFNQFVNAGVDTDYRRQKLTRTLSNQPFYSIPITGSILISHGGIAVNHLLQAVDANDTAIQGLFAVGETLGSAQMMGTAVLSGMSVGPAITLGRLAARNAFRYARSDPFLLAECENVKHMENKALS
ncbi:MAG: FAD-dependent oxidoreductase [Gammaproteobacteria bacterium]|nr:FAD-dependent oxidoreductase [Gammaproteobacteria bacterium]MBT5202141.1 FAD-dependent oxidoreductase [Gammaproteobacteria bacterium]MBT5600839.1 FAD-dependent oxidoreductase [Gammaproteobacteria bacterium]MBT6246195.1 FAD-dependent oxidoreductase [Gammaproteobacteria bacterium]